MSDETTQVEQDVERIFDKLVGNPFHGDSYALAAALGIPQPRLTTALGRIRRQTEENGWTVPLVRRGGFSAQVYAVVPTDGRITDEEHTILEDGVERHSDAALTMMDTIRQQAVVLKAITAPRTPERRWANQLLSTATYLVEQGRLLQEQKAEREASVNSR